MMGLIIALFVIGLVAGLFGFYNLESVSFGLAELLIIVSLIFIVIAALLGLGILHVAA